VETLFIVGSEPLLSVNDVRSFEMAFQTEILREGYLGETTDRRDEIFRGIRGRMELHFENDDVFGLFTSIVNRARRREPGVKVNVKATLNFPNGDRPRIIIPNVFFGEIPIAFGSRSDYGTIGMDFEAESADILTT